MDGLLRSLAWSVFVIAFLVVEVMSVIGFIYGVGKGHWVVGVISFVGMVVATGVGKWVMDESHSRGDRAFRVDHWLEIWDDVTGKSSELDRSKT